MLYINGRFLLQAQTGVNRFAYELCQALHTLRVPFVLLCPPGPIKPCYHTEAFTIKRCGRGHSHGWEQLFLPLSFWRQPGRNLLLNFTGIGPVAVRRKLMTIHDLAFLVNPRWYTPTYVWLYRLLTPLSARTARRVITVSHFSKSEIKRLLGLPDRRIAVVYNAVAAHFGPRQPQSSPPAERYVLAVSSIDPRKNFATLLQAFALLRHQEVKLYVVGGQNRIYTTTVSQLSQGADAVSHRIKWLSRVTDEELARYYAQAECFVYPSLYEGFGIPPLEAMACGVPCVVSDIPPLREVCADAALYAPPTDAALLAARLDQLLGSPDLQAQLRAKGQVRCRQFSWTQSARALCQVIDSLS